MKRVKAQVLVNGAFFKAVLDEGRRLWAFPLLLKEGVEVAMIEVILSSDHQVSMRCPVKRFFVAMHKVATEADYVVEFPESEIERMRKVRAAWKSKVRG